LFAGAFFVPVLLLPVPAPVVAPPFVFELFVCDVVGRLFPALFVPLPPHQPLPPHPTIRMMMITITKIAIHPPPP
jgi:hypothetical protein